MSTTTEGYSRAARLDELAPGRMLGVMVSGDRVCIARVGDELFALEDRCTHDDGSLAGGEVESCEIICPRHGARFSLRTGEALTPPAYEPVRTFNVRLMQGRILVERPA